MANLCTRTLVKKLWAKSSPFPALWQPSLDVCATAEQLIKSLGYLSELPDTWACFLCGLHDIGKADIRFQGRDNPLAEDLRNSGVPLPEASELFRHEARTGQWIIDYLQYQHGWGKRAARVVSSAMRGHHGYFPKDEYKESKTYHAEHEFWLAARSELAGLVSEAFSEHLHNCAIESFNNASVVGIQLAGLTVLADWIASNEELYRFTQLSDEDYPIQYFERARNEAERAVKCLQLTPSMALHTGRFQEVWPEISELNPSQRVIEKLALKGLPRGMLLIEAPTGEGKTESAIYVSECMRTQHKMRGTYIALPTMATSNQIHSRYAEFLRRARSNSPNARLVHGMAWLIDESTPENMAANIDGREDTEYVAAEWFRPSKRALIAPEGVGTIDQALMAAMIVKHGLLRLFGLSSKVLIIDEIHAYDDYTTEIIVRLLEWCHALQMPVVILSATLSNRQKTKLVAAYRGETCEQIDEKAYPLITVVPVDDSPIVSYAVEGQPAKTVPLVKHIDALDDTAAAAKLAIDSVKVGGCACVIANTVKNAQDIYTAIEKDSCLADETELFLFHARFPAWRRTEIEKKITSVFGKGAGQLDNPPRPVRAIVVATQVVEQSLDLDFDVLISQLAPIDLLLQRAGRLWRHSGTLRPPGVCAKMHLLLPAPNSPNFGPSEHVYGALALQRTLTIVDQIAEFLLPQHYRTLIEACYGDGNIASEVISMRREEEARVIAELRRAKEIDKAHEWLVPAPETREFRLAQTTGAEDESNLDVMFGARTRLGDLTVQALVLEDPTLLKATASSKPPSREVLKQLFSHKVDIPRWWLKDIEPSTLRSGKSWLRGCVILPMSNGSWQGTANNKRREIKFDRTKGVMMIQQSL